MKKESPSFDRSIEFFRGGRGIVQRLRRAENIFSMPSPKEPDGVMRQGGTDARVCS
jgi:hypothetical protein